MSDGSSILIVDRSDEGRLVLRTALERRGSRILEASHSAMGLALARRHRPDLIVVDLDTARRCGTPAGEFTACADGTGGALVFLGTACSPTEPSSGQFVPKPYHYQPLILKIEELLGERRRRAA